MVNAPRTGGIAALVAAATFVIGIAMFATAMSDDATGDPSPSESVAFLVDNQVAFQVWNIIIYICFGIALVPLAIAVHARLTADSPLLTPIATSFGLIWAGLGVLLLREAHAETMPDPQLTGGVDMTDPAPSRRR